MLINAWLARGGRAEGIRAGEAYVDVGNLHGYREAIQLVSSHARAFTEAATHEELHRERGRLGSAGGCFCRSRTRAELHVASWPSQTPALPVNVFRCNCG